MVSNTESRDVKFAFLGTSASIPTSARDNTSVVFYSPAEAILVDCGSAPVRKLEMIGVPLDNLKHVIVTHTHIDHIYGVPSLLHALWLKGREEKLTFHCFADTQPVIQKLIDTFGLLRKKAMFPIEIEVVPDSEHASVLKSSSFVVHSSLMNHNVPTMGIRVEEKLSGDSRVVTYSCDTEPCEALVRLATKADVLIQECAFLSDTVDRHGHTIGTEAGEIAGQASVERLFLVHIDPSAQLRTADLIAEAKQKFEGPVVIPDDLSIYSFAT